MGCTASVPILDHEQQQQQLQWSSKQPCVVSSNGSFKRPTDSSTHQAEDLRCLDKYDVSESNHCLSNAGSEDAMYDPNDSDKSLLRQSQERSPYPSGTDMLDAPQSLSDDDSISHSMPDISVRGENSIGLVSPKPVESEKVKDTVATTIMSPDRVRLKDEIDRLKAHIEQLEKIKTAQPAVYVEPATLVKKSVPSNREDESSGCLSENGGSAITYASSKAGSSTPGSPRRSNGIAARAAMFEKKATSKVDDIPQNLKSPTRSKIGSSLLREAAPELNKLTHSPLRETDSKINKLANSPLREAAPKVDKPTNSPLREAAPKINKLTNSPLRKAATKEQKLATSPLCETSPKIIKLQVCDNSITNSKEVSVFQKPLPISSPVRVEQKPNASVYIKSWKKADSDTSEAIKMPLGTQTKTSAHESNEKSQVQALQENDDVVHLASGSIHPIKQPANSSKHATNLPADCKLSTAPLTDAKQINTEKAEKAENTLHKNVKQPTDTAKQETKLPTHRKLYTAPPSDVKQSKTEEAGESEKSADNNMEQPADFLEQEAEMPIDSTFSTAPSPGVKNSNTKKAENSGNSFEQSVVGDLSTDSTDSIRKATQKRHPENNNQRAEQFDVAPLELLGKTREDLQSPGRYEAMVEDSSEAILTDDDIIAMAEVYISSAPTSTVDENSNATMLNSEREDSEFETSVGIYSEGHSEACLADSHSGESALSADNMSHLSVERSSTTNSERRLQGSCSSTTYESAQATASYVSLTSKIENLENPLDLKNSPTSPLAESVLHKSDNTSIVSKCRDKVSKSEPSKESTQQKPVHSSSNDSLNLEEYGLTNTEFQESITAMDAISDSSENEKDEDSRRKRKKREQQSKQMKKKTAKSQLTSIRIDSNDSNQVDFEPLHGKETKTAKLNCHADNVSVASDPVGEMSQKKKSYTVSSNEDSKDGKKVAENHSFVRDSKSKIDRKSEFFDLLNLDPWNQDSKIANEKVLQIISQHPKYCRKKYNFEGFNGLVYPLCALCALGASVETVKQCYKAYPAAIAETDSYVGAPLHYACSYRAPLDVVIFLAKKKTDVLKEFNKFKRLPLHMACMFGAHRDVVSFLLETCAGAAKKSDADGMTPLHLACEADSRADQEVVDQLLVSYPEACVSRDMAGGSTPLQLAIARHVPHSMVEALVKANKKSLSVADNKGRMPLHIAVAVKSDVNTFKLLVEHYPEGILSKNKVLETPYAFAERTKLDPVILQVLKP